MHLWICKIIILSLYDEQMYKFSTLKMIFVFNSLNIKYFNENLSGGKNKGTRLWWHGRRREACREKEKGRKEKLLSKFMIFSIQKCNVK